MKATIRWNPKKERVLLEDKTRGGISFADCVVAIEEGRVLDIASLEHQHLLVLNIENYAYVAPFVIEGNGSWFLKTVFPSRKFTALYLKRDDP